MIVKPSLLDHPKFLRLHAILGQDSLFVLLRVWAHCEIDQRMEVWTNKDPAYLESVARWNGTPGAAFEALTRTGFVDWDGRTIRIHDWNGHNGTMVSKWVNGPKGGRGAKKHTPNPDSVSSVPSSVEPNPDSVSSVPSSVEPNPDSGVSERREEKRREVEDTHAREGDGASAFAEAPSVEEVLAFGSGFRGEMASGVPGPIDPAYCRSWWERKDNSRNGGWSTLVDWRRALVSSWRADFRKTFWKGGSASTSTSRERAESVPLGIRIRELEKAAEEHVGNPENTRGTLEAKAKGRAAWLALKKQIRELRGQLTCVEVEP